MQRNSIGPVGRRVMPPVQGRQRSAAIALAMVFAVTVAPQAGEMGDPLERGDRSYAARGESNDGRGRAEPQRITQAIAAYEEALARDRGDLAARWKAMAALYFAGDFAAPNEEAAHRLYDRGRVLGEEGIERVHERLGLRGDLAALDAQEIRGAVPEASVKDVGLLYFWAAIHWGAWSRSEGFLKIVSQGVAGRLRDYARVSRALDPGIYRAGNQRLLAHMHANLPRVPFISGWIDRKKALAYAEEAMAIRPDDMGNQAIWGLVVLEVAPERRDEALAILEKVVRAEPRAELVVEDQATQVMAQERLARERKR